MQIACYIIKCVDNTFYTGITKDLQKRFEQHKTGRCRYTRQHVAKEIVYTTYATSYSEARIIEKFIKKMGAKKYLYSQGVFL